MKKLMIAAAIVCAAAMSQAASVDWSSGTLYFGGEGSKVNLKTGQTRLTTNQGTMYLFTHISEKDYALLAAMTDADIYGAFTEAGADSTLALGKSTYSFKSAGGDGYTSAKTGSGGNVTFASESGYSNGDFVSGVAIILFDENLDGKADYYTVSYASDTATTQGADMTTMGLAKEFGSTPNVWSAVPEPTSGLLLLIGVGALALRRRRA